MKLKICIITLITLVIAPIFITAAELPEKSGSSYRTVNWENRNEELDYDKLVHNMKRVGFSGIMTISAGALLQSTSLILTAIIASGAIPYNYDYYLSGPTTNSIMMSLIGAFAGIGGIVLATGLILAIIGYAMVARYMRMKIELSTVAYDPDTGDSTFDVALSIKL